MATMQEVKDRLKSMNDAAFEAFQRSFGVHDSREKMIQRFVHEPSLERLYCERLGLMTEEEKQGAAATRSAYWTRVGGVIAVLGLVATIIIWLIGRL
jgi:hypothetical protein